MPIIAAVQGYDLNIGVGQAQAIDVAGDRVQFVSATDPFAAIEIRPNFSQGNIVLKPGQGYRFAEQVQRWVVYNLGNVPLTGNLLIGTGDFFDQRISGTVDVIDGGKARTLGGIAFTGYANSVAVAAKYGAVQLWNPAGSAKNAIVEQIIGYAGSGGVVLSYVMQNAVPLTTLKQVGQSKKVGTAVSVMELRSDNLVAAPGYPTLTVVSTPAGGMAPFKPAEPIVVTPGMGLLVHTTSVNLDMAGAFEWYEEAA